MQTFHLSSRNFSNTLEITSNSVWPLYKPSSNLKRSNKLKYIVMILVTTDGVWIGNWIYWILTTYNYK
jgi:Fic family protein